MKKDRYLYILVGLLIVALYLTTKSYRNFSLEKSISACVYAQIKKNPDLKSKDAKLYCENEIKVKKNE